MPLQDRFSQRPFLKYVEPALLAAFLAGLGYLALTTAPEQALQTASIRSAPAEPLAAGGDSEMPEPLDAPRRRSSAGSSSPPAEDLMQTADHRPVRDDFGMAKAAFDVETGRVRPRQTFADLLTGTGVSYAKAVQLANEARPVFDVRHMQAGKRYRLYRQNGVPQRFVYQRGPVDYVAFDLGDSLAVRAGERPISTVRRTASGTIDRSLYGAIDAAGADLSLAQALAKVYAWQIDFYRVRPGDRFRVVYEEERVGGEVIGTGRILGARFDHRGDPYYGLYFAPEDEYFDEAGRSLRKSLLKTPLEFARISSNFQKRRFHPVQKRWKAHRGTDYAAPTGTPVYSVGDGRVVKAGYTRANGYWVKVRHNEKYTTGYLHFSKIADGIEPGVRVKQKQVIGYVGETGLATGPHLHYAFWKHGRLVNAREQTLPSAPPVPDSLRSAYDDLKADLLPRLRPDAPEALANAPAEASIPDSVSARSRGRVWRGSPLLHARSPSLLAERP